MPESPVLASTHCHIAPLINTPLIKAIVSDSSPKERKEALPLPLYVVTQWEKHLCSDDCNDAFRILLGGFLLEAHASLRFGIGDLQRIKWDSIALSWTSFRGTCYATKTTVGQPFAILPFGLSRRDISSCWLVPYLEALSRSWEATTALMGDVGPDFMLPCIHPSEFETSKRILFGQPMSYAQALTNLRWAVRLPWLPDEEPAISIVEASTALRRVSSALQLCCVCRSTLTASKAIINMSRKAGEHRALKQEEASIPSLFNVPVGQPPTCIDLQQLQEAIPRFLVNSDLKTGFRPQGNASASTRPYDSEGQTVSQVAPHALLQAPQEVSCTQAEPTQSTIAVPSLPTPLTLLRTLRNRRHRNPRVPPSPPPAQPSASPADLALVGLDLPQLEQELTEAIDALNAESPCVSDHASSRTSEAETLPPQGALFLDCIRNGPWGAVQAIPPRLKLGDASKKQFTYDRVSNLPFCMSSAF